LDGFEGHQNSRRSTVEDSLDGLKVDSFHDSCFDVAEDEGKMGRSGTPNAADTPFAP